MNLDLTIIENLAASKAKGTGLKCPDCGGHLFPESGCWFCPSCGYSTC